jgi:hypothetical protein
MALTLVCGGRREDFSVGIMKTTLIALALLLPLVAQERVDVAVSRTSNLMFSCTATVLAGQFVEPSGMTEFPRFKMGILHPPFGHLREGHLAAISWFGVPVTRGPYRSVSICSVCMICECSSLRIFADRIQHLDASHQSRYL